MKKIIAIISLLLILTTIKNKNTITDNIIIPTNAIRFRIIANSNEAKDQAMKLDIKTKFQEELFPILSTANDVDEARNVIVNNMSQINNVLLGYNIPYNVSYGSNYFPQKNFKGIDYEAGDYESLVITLGKGIGENWWCVLFPPLCLLEAEENETDEVEYKSFVKEWLDKYF